MNQSSQPPAELEAAPAGEAVLAPVAAQPIVQAPSIVVRLLAVLKREPVMFVTLAYLFVSFLGLWSSFWFYRRFGVPILEYLQSGDFFVAGLRRPQFMLLLGVSLFWLWLSAWPMRWAERNHERAEIVPIDSIARIESLDRPLLPSTSEGSVPATKAPE